MVSVVHIISSPRATRWNMHIWTGSGRIFRTKSLQPVLKQAGFRAKNAVGMVPLLEKKMFHISLQSTDPETKATVHWEGWLSKPTLRKNIIDYAEEYDMVTIKKAQFGVLTVVGVEGVDNG